VVNKIDLPQVKARLAEIRDNFTIIGTRVFFVSAATGDGLPQLMTETMRLLELVAESEAGVKIPKKVFHPQPRVIAPSVHKEGDTFVVTAPELERIDARTDVTSPHLPRELRRQLVRLGVTRALERAGVKPGDKVRCGNFEWEWS